MAGHSKWHNIQHRKNLQDSKKSKIFSKFIREIFVATRIAGEDKDSNPRLRLAIEKALAMNMKKNVIENAIKRGSGKADNTNYEEVTYEGYGTGGTAIIVDCLTDNNNRTVAQIRHIFTKNNKSLGVSGSVAYLFNKRGIISFNNNSNIDEIVEIAIENNAVDINNDSNNLEIIAELKDFNYIKEILTKNNFIANYSEITMLPDNYIKLSGEDCEKFIKMIEALEDLEDVQNVYHNAITD